MLLFQVTEPDERPDPLDPGLRFEQVEGEYRVPIGYRSEVTDPLVAMPLGKSLADGFDALQGKGLPVEPYIHRAEVTEVRGQLLFTKEKQSATMALVVLGTMAGENGQLLLTSNVHDEMLEEQSFKRVKKIHRPFPSVGVTLLNPRQVTITDEGVCQGSNSLLLQLVQHASFRVCRTGDLQGATPEFIVSWNGFNLRTVIPAKYRRKTREQEQRERDQRRTERGGAQHTVEVMRELRDFS